MGFWRIAGVTLCCRDQPERACAGDGRTRECQPSTRDACRRGPDLGRSPIVSRTGSPRFGVCGSSRRQRPGARPPHTPQCAPKPVPKVRRARQRDTECRLFQRLPSHGKEGVSGSSPEEGSKIPAKRIFLLSRLVQQSTSRVRRDSTWWPRPAALCSAKSGSHQGRTGVSNAPTRDYERHAQTRTATRKPA